MTHPHVKRRGFGSLVAVLACAFTLFALVYSNRTQAPCPSEQVSAAPFLQTLQTSLPTSSMGTSDGSAKSEGLAFVRAAQQEQAAYCLSRGPELKGATSLKTEGFAYRRVEGVQAGLGGAGLNMSMWIYDGDDIVSRGIERHGAWERHETGEVLRKLAQFAQDRALPPSDVYFVDIGANVGWFTHNVAAMGYSVVAFEPTTPNALAIRQTMCDVPLLHSRISLVNKGLGEKEQRCRVFADATNVGDGHVNCNPDAPVPKGNVVHGEFALTTLDGFFTPSYQALSGRMGVLKIDVEGFEDRVFKGGDKFMQLLHPQYIMAEFHAKFSDGTTAEQLLEMFDGWGYTAHSGGFDGPMVPKSQFATVASDPNFLDGKLLKKMDINLFFTHT